MADHADDFFDGDIFIYRGGRAPQHVTHVLIDKSVDVEIEDWAFDSRENLVQVETHNSIRKIGIYAFCGCISLPKINLKSVVEIEKYAFCRCVNLESIEFGDRSVSIGNCAFRECSSLEHLKLPSIINIGHYAFSDCERLTDVELSERLEIIGPNAFKRCECLQRIAVPLKRDLFAFDDFFEKYNQFDKCEQLTKVDLVGGIGKTVASLHMESWRTEMNEKINRINQVLPNTLAKEKTEEIRQWMEMVLYKMDRFKVQHCRYVKEGITLLELALWKAKLGEQEEYAEEGQRKKKAKVDAECSRKDKRITCGADIVIKNVLPFLQLE